MQIWRWSTCHCHYEL